MKVSEQDADLFFKLMFGLQMFVNKRLGILPAADSLDKYMDADMEEKLLVRDAVYENSQLIDEYVELNPDGFSDDELAIIAKWQQSVSGEFFIERMLKKHAIFIASDNKVYGVLGLHQSFEDMIDPIQLPVYVQTVLLPFKGKIVYDGLMQPYSVFFGSGISSELKEDYMAAKQNGRIIESLDMDARSHKNRQSRKKLKDWRPEIDALMTEAQKLRSGAGQPPILGPAFSLTKASLELAQAAAHDPEDLDALWKRLSKLERALDYFETVLHRAERR